MEQFRRSLKSDGGKHDSAKPVQISIPQKDAIAIEPPKKVLLPTLYNNINNSNVSSILLSLRAKLTPHPRL